MPGWGFDDLLPYFKKSEDQSRGASEWHGAGGPIAVPTCRPPRAVRRLHRLRRWRSAFRATTISTAPTQEGTGYYQATARNGRRCSTAVGYLRPAREAAEPAASRSKRSRPRVLFEGKRATGVDYEAQGAKTRGARGARSDPLPAARFNSPQLLQLSGVGPRALLERHGIPVVHDAPRVGEDLQDHFYVPHVLALLHGRSR